MTPVEYIVWGIVIHLVADWLLQNEWMSLNKMRRRQIRSRDRYFDQSIGVERKEKRDSGVEGKVWDRHPAAYVHSGIHLLLFLIVFPWWAAILLGVVHFFIDMRTPVVWWSKLIRQSQPGGSQYDIGAEVRIWTDQVFHILTIALVALIISVV